MRKFLCGVCGVLFILVACINSDGKSRDASVVLAGAGEPVAVAAVSAESAVTAAPVVDAPPVAPAPVSSACPADMAEVQGKYCPNLTETCLEWMAPDDNFRCKRFAKSVCRGATVDKHFCVDRYEYPNRQGEAPTVSVLWGDAQKLCREQGKRLCSASEWTFACQGPQWKPYPYGWNRDSNACRIDLGAKEPRWADAPAAGYGRTPRPLHGEACVNFSKPSGEYPACVSDFGVRDLTGNVDEWVSADGSAGGASWLKGGWWGNLRNRCGEEATTTGHGKDYAAIQVGFRCCADAAR
jgi:sulfatase modifying factor 1